MQKLSNDVLEEISEYIISDDLLRLHCTGDKKLQYRMSKYARRVTKLYTAFKNYTGVRYLNDISHIAACRMTIKMGYNVYIITTYTSYPLAETTVCITHKDIHDFIKNAIDKYPTMEIVLVLANATEFKFSNPTSCINIFKDLSESLSRNIGHLIYDEKYANMDNIVEMSIYVSTDILNFPPNIIKLKLYLRHNNTIDVSNLKYLKKICVTGWTAYTNTIIFPTHAIKFKHAGVKMEYKNINSISGYTHKSVSNISASILQQLSPIILTKFKCDMCHIKTTYIQQFVNLKILVVKSISVDVDFPTNIVVLKTAEVKSDDKSVLARLHKLQVLECWKINDMELPPNLTKLSTGNVSVNEISSFPQRITDLNIGLAVEKSKTITSIDQLHISALRAAVSNTNPSVINLTISLGKYHITPLYDEFPKHIRRFITPCDRYARDLDGNMKRV